MKNLLNEAQHEILRLRRENEILQAKAEVMDLFACVLHTSPASRNQGMSPDVAWKLQKAIDEMELKERNDGSSTDPVSRR